MSDKMPVIVVASGYFSPLHSSHIEYLELSKALGDILIIVVNNDKQEKLKKGEVFIECSERMKIVRALSCVDMVVEAVDQDRSISITLAILRPNIFTNGGDQFNNGIPEAEICNKLGIKMIDGLGEKKQSSSAIIARAKKIGNYKKRNHVIKKEENKEESPEEIIIVSPRTKKRRKKKRKSKK